MKSHLLPHRDTVAENVLNFKSAPTLGNFRHFLIIFCEELLEYHVWPENCWFLCSLLQEYLAAEGGGVFGPGTLIYPDLGIQIRRTIHTRVYSHDYYFCLVKANVSLTSTFDPKPQWHPSDGSPPLRYEINSLSFPDDSIGGAGNYVGSALIIGANGKPSVQPCQILRGRDPCCLVVVHGQSVEHRGKYNILPITDDMVWVSARDGVIPEGCVPVDGGYEETGERLYHAHHDESGRPSIGKTAPHLGGAEIPFRGYGRRVLMVYSYKLLCWAPWCTPVTHQETREELTPEYDGIPTQERLGTLPPLPPLAR